MIEREATLSGLRPAALASPFPGRREVVAGLALSGLAANAAAQNGGDGWRKLPAEPYPGKQDDIVFIGPDVGWYGNGKGRVFGTRDGGATWSRLWEQPGTFVRALGFVDERVGFLGNIGVGSFPGVTDTIPLYRTRDGGRTWSPVTEIAGPAPSGICALDVLRQPFVNAGVLDTRVTIRAGGRVGGPAHLMTSSDGGATWRSEDLSARTAAILDIRFLDERIGFIAGASDPDVSVSNAVVLMTRDGGTSWRRVYQSRRPFEITWKLAFPSRRVGYVTVQNYDPDPKVVARVIAKTTDGGLTWREIPLTRNHAQQEFGIGFVDERRGWVGGLSGGFETRDGGASWRAADLGPAVNKIRIVRGSDRACAFAIGLEVRRLDLL